MAMNVGWKIPLTLALSWVTACSSTRTATLTPSEGGAMTSPTGGSGGDAASGGALALGGQTTKAGDTGSTIAVGGTVATGGRAPNPGGSAAAGGTPNPAGGAGPAGGVLGAGGTIGNGGIPGAHDAGAKDGNVLDSNTPASGGTSGVGPGGTTAKGGTTSTGGSAAMGGTTNTGGSSSSGGVVTTDGGVIWPNELSKANSDTWLSQNHDRITQLQPRVLVIDLENTATAQTQVDKHIAALKEASSPHKFKDATAAPNLAYQLVKIVRTTKNGAVNYNTWNTQTFADSTLQIKDPANPTGPNLTLCGLFEKGIIHEVWCMASSDPKCGETQEEKQVYDASGTKVAGKFANVSNGPSIASLGCKVTARITDFNSGRGVGCHMHALGHGWENYIRVAAVPTLAKQGKRFLNLDLDTRLGMAFSSFYGVCNSDSVQLTNCIVWASQIHAQSGATAVKKFDIPDLSGGCGNAHFYANTTGTYSYDATTPDPTVLSSCENYGMHNGAGGKDLTTTYTNAMTDTLFRNVVDDDCGGHGTMYIYQNFPGPGTSATNDDGTPMHSWWPYLFY